MPRTVMVILVLVAIAALSAGTVYGGQGERGGRGGHRFEGLTEEQRAEVHELVSGMREAGASRDDIHAAVAALFESWGLEAPKPPEGRCRGEGRGEGKGERRGRGQGRGPRHHALMELLTEEQRTEVRALVTGMREDGASHEEIRAAVNALLESWGIEPPEKCKEKGDEIGTLISPAEGESATWGEIKGDYR